MSACSTLKLPSWSPIIAAATAAAELAAAAFAAADLAGGDAGFGGQSRLLPARKTPRLTPAGGMVLAAPGG
jgi:hypothetical protein